MATRRLGGEDGLDAREVERFEAVMLPHLDAAYTLARYLMRNTHDAEDVVQDACLRALKYFNGFTGEGRPVRARGCWRSCATPLTARGGAAEWRPMRPSSMRRPIATLSRTTTRRQRCSGAPRKNAVARALDRLVPEFREVIVLRELEGLSYKEISVVAGVPVGTVMSRLSRARSRLQEALRESEGR